MLCFVHCGLSREQTMSFQTELLGFPILTRSWSSFSRTKVGDKNDLWFSDNIQIHGAVYVLDKWQQKWIKWYICPWEIPLPLLMVIAGICIQRQLSTDDWDRASTWCVWAHDGERPWRPCLISLWCLWRNIKVIKASNNLPQPRLLFHSLIFMKWHLTFWLCLK